MAEASERPAGLRASQSSANSCDNMRQHGRCKFGDDCFYAHSQEESELFVQWARTQKKQQLANRGPPDQYFRTQICQRWREGTCRNGAACTFAHGEEALRAPRPRPPPLGPPPQQAQLQGDAGAGEEGRSVNDRLRWEAERPSMGSGHELSLQQQQQQRRPQLCWYWHERGSCKHGDQCLFVHGERSSSLEDVAPPPGFERSASSGRGEWVCPPDKYKTQLCIFFMEQGNCRHGENCNFAHGLEELPHHRREAVLRDTSAYRGPPGITRPEGHQQGNGVDGWAPSPHFSPPRSNGDSARYFAPPLPPPLPPNPPGLEAGSPVDHNQQQLEQEQQQQSDQPSLGLEGGQSSSAATVRAAAYNPLTHVLPLPLPSLASSDGGVALSDDDFPPLGGPGSRRSAPPSVRSMHSTAPSMRSQGSGPLDPAAPGATSASLSSSAAGPAYTAPGGGALLPPAAVDGGSHAAVETRSSGSRSAACSSGGPSTPSQASLGAMLPGPESTVGSALGSPTMSEGRVGVGSVCKPSTGCSTAPVLHMTGNATSALAVPTVGPAAAANMAESVGESALAHAPASYPASMDGSGYHAGASSSGYETAEEDAPSSAVVSQDRPATSAAVPPAPSSSHAPPALTAAAAPSAPTAAAQAQAAPVSFLAFSSPGSSRPEQPAVEVTFNSNPASAPSSAGSLTPQLSTELDSRSSKGGSARPQRAAPPGYEKPRAYHVSATAAAAGGVAPPPMPQPLPLAPATGPRAVQQQQRRRWGDIAEEEEELAAVAAAGGQASPPQGPGSPAAGSLQRPARVNSSGCPMPVAPGAPLVAHPPPPPLAPAPQAPAPPAGFNLSSVHSFRCPLTKTLFTDPVVAADGYTYERAAIHDWLYRQNQDVSPMTYQPLVHKVLVPNLTIRTAMGEIGHLMAGLAPTPVAPPHPASHNSAYRPLLAAVRAQPSQQLPVAQQR